eukprot:m.60350 g.60350  ORF g.60350 m.60350 type:complete len:192 (+) comp22830_c0_seq3:383-958(+)
MASSSLSTRNGVGIGEGERGLFGSYVLMKAQPLGLGLLPIPDILKSLFIGWERKWLEIDRPYVHIKSSKDIGTAESTMFLSQLQTTHDVQGETVTLVHGGTSFTFKSEHDDNYREWVRQFTGIVLPPVESEYEFVERTNSMPGVGEHDDRGNQKIPRHTHEGPTAKSKSTRTECTDEQAPPPYSRDDPTTN